MLEGGKEGQQVLGTLPDSLGEVGKQSAGLIIQPVRKKTLTNKKERGGDNFPPARGNRKYRSNMGGW